MTSDALMKALQEGTCSLCYRPVKLCCALFPSLDLGDVAIPKEGCMLCPKVARNSVDVFILDYFRGGTLK